MEGPSEKIKVTGAETLRKKYFTSWFLPLVAYVIVFVLWPVGFFSFIIFGVALIFGTLFSQLKVIWYDADFMYISSNKVSFEHLIKISGFNINDTQLFIIKCKHQGKVKRFYVLPNSALLFSFIFILFGHNKSVNRTIEFLKYAEFKMKENQERRLDIIKSQRRHR